MDYSESGCKNLPRKSVKCFINEIVYCSSRNPKDKTPPEIVYNSHIGNDAAQYSALLDVSGISEKVQKRDVHYEAFWCTSYRFSASAVQHLAV